jgi:MFS superfamily sulfate permease-like transporter
MRIASQTLAAHAHVKDKHRRSCTICSSTGTAADPGPLYGTTNSCIGSAIPYEKALVSSLTLDGPHANAQDVHALTPATWQLQAATFLEGIVFLIICFTGMRSRLIKIFPRTVLMAGACGIGVFIAFVGVKVRSPGTATTGSAMLPLSDKVGSLTWSNGLKSH